MPGLNKDFTRGWLVQRSSERWSATSSHAGPWGPDGWPWQNWAQGLGLFSLFPSPLLWGVPIWGPLIQENLQSPG